MPHLQERLNLIEKKNGQERKSDPNRTITRNYECPRRNADLEERRGNPRTPAAASLCCGARFNGLRLGQRWGQTASSPDSSDLTGRDIKQQQKAIRAETRYSDGSLSWRPGPMTPEEIAQTLRAADLTLPEDEMKTFEEGVAILLDFIARLDDAPPTGSSEGDAS